MFVGCVVGVVGAVVGCVVGSVVGCVVGSVVGCVVGEVVVCGAVGSLAGGAVVTVWRTDVSVPVGAVLAASVTADGAGSVCVIVTTAVGCAVCGVSGSCGVFCAFSRNRPATAAAAAALTVNGSK
ncbi:MAG: hypothetical protein IK118_02585 [Clostridia bacterium]|nr:hypothetical protein [Clostridia bacterium]